MFTPIILCTLLAIIGGNKTDETFASTNHAQRTRRGVASIIAKIMKDAKFVQADSITTVYKKKGGYCQALMDFKKLVPTPTRTKGTTQWGDIGKRRVYLRNDYGNPVVTIWTKDKKKDIFTIDKIQY